MSSMPFERDEYESRWSAVYAEMRRLGFSSVVVWSRGGGCYDRFQEVYYLANYYSCNSGYGYDGLQKGTRAAAHCAVVLQLGHEPILIADDPTVDLGIIATSRVESNTDVIAALCKVLDEERIQGPVGFVGFDCISAKHMADLRELAPQIEWRPQDDLVLNLRVIKSPAELDVIRYAGQTVSTALETLFTSIFAGKSEAEAAGEAAREVYRRQGSINFVHVGHGPWTGERMTDVPIAGYSTRTPDRSELVRGWIYGPMYKGYWLDPGRTSVAGLKPTTEQKRLVEACANIVTQLQGKIRPGARVADVAKLGVRLQREFGGCDSYEPGWFIYGHGNGLYFEPPFIAPDYVGPHDVFKENMVASTEAFLNVPGLGSAGFEQNFIITKEGTELLTTTPMIWW